MDQEIMTLLSKLVEDVSDIKKDQNSLRSEISDIKKNQLNLQEGQHEFRSTVDKLTATVDKLAINQENVMMPQLQTLYEGQATLINQLKGRAATERVEEIESTVHILKEATVNINKDIKTIKSDIAQLKQA